MRVFEFLLIIFFLCVTGCASSTAVKDWKTLPPNSPIEVHTNDGKAYEFQNWQIDKDSDIVGMANTGPNSWRSFTIPIQSVVTVTPRDSQTTQAIGTTVIVIGSVAIVATVLWLYYNLPHFGQP